MRKSSADHRQRVLERWSRRVLRDLERLWAAPGLAEGCRVEYSTRMIRSLGRCYPGRALLRINAELADRPHRALLRETLVHEAAHLVDFARNPRRRKPHGPGWKRLMEAAGYATRATIRSERLPDAWGPRPPRVRLRCTNCGQTWLRRRSDRRWRCPPCLAQGRSGRLSVERLPRCG